jgi:hypothetical protein
MVRISKQAERRGDRPHRCRPPSPKTGPKADQLPLGYKEHANACSAEANPVLTFIPKVGI